MPAISRLLLCIDTVKGPAKIAQASPFSKAQLLNRSESCAEKLCVTWHACPIKQRIILAIIGVALGILAYMSSHFEFASFLNIMFIPGAEELVVFAAAFIGATVGFLWYNAYPAQVFMGDTGSLTLGGIIAVFAIIIRKELLIPILCGIFLVENLSVLMQTFYFKYTKKKYGEGRRIFKMAPLHHHFQKPGNAGIQALIQKPFNVVPESKIVVRFWLIGIILAVITIVTLKMR